MHGWWIVSDLKTGENYKHWDLPLRMVPCIKKVDIKNGHETTHKEIVVRVQNAKVDLNTGAIWYNKQLIDNIKNPDKIIFFKRTKRNNVKKSSEIQYFIGLVNKDGEGKIIRIKNNSEWRLEPYKTGIPVHD